MSVKVPSHFIVDFTGQGDTLKFRYNSIYRHQSTLTVHHETNSKHLIYIVYATIEMPQVESLEENNNQKFKIDTI